MKFANVFYLWLLTILPIVLLLRIFWHRYREKIVVPHLSLWLVKPKFRLRTFFDNWLRYICAVLLAIILFFSIVLALAAPSTGNSPQQLVIVADNSASMRTQEKQGSRWQLGKRLLNKYLAGGHRTTILLTAPKPHIVSRNQLAAIEPANSGNPQQAISLAVTLAKQGKTIIVTDGAGTLWKRTLDRLQKQAQRPILHIIGQASENVGVRLCEAYQDLHKQVNIGLEITNYGKQEQNRTLSWQFKDSKSQVGDKNAISMVLEPGKTAMQRIDFVAPQGGVFVCRLLGKDAFAQDDKVVCTIPKWKKAKILLVTDKPQPYLLSALATYPWLVDKRHSAITQSTNVPSGYDLVIIHKLSWSAPLPEAHLLIWGTQIPQLSFTQRGTAKKNVCWGTYDHIVTRNLNLINLQVTTVEYRLPQANTVLAYSNHGPLIWKGKYRNSPYIYSCFPLEASQFPLLPAFPVFIHNVILWALRSDVPPKLRHSQIATVESNIAPFSYPKIPVTIGNAAEKHWRYQLIWLALLCSLIWGLLKARWMFRL